MPQNRIIQIINIALGIAILITATVGPARAQVFADRKTALVDYSKADFEPGRGGAGRALVV